MRIAITTILFLAVMLFPSVSPAHAEENELEFSIINAANGLADNSSQIIVCTKTGRMIISTMGNLNFYDGNSFTHIDMQQDYQFPLPLYKGNDHLYFDHSHHIWLKNTHCVTCVDLLNEVFIQNAEAEIRKMGCEGQVQDLFTDNDGDLWVLTENGLYDVDSMKTFQVMKDRNLQDVDVYDNLLLTFYDNGEVLALNRVTGRVEHSTKPYEWEVAQRYISFSSILQYEDSYFQIRNGKDEAVLLRLDLKSFQWTTVMQVPYHLNNMAVKGNKVYIASSFGYWIYNTTDNSLRHIEQIKLENGRLLATACNTIAFDKQGGLWIGTENRGVLYARPYASPFRVYGWDQPEAKEYEKMMAHITQTISEFNGKRANCMFTDSRKYTWFGTTTGLYLFREPQSEPVVFNKKNGFLNNVVHAIVEDKDSNIWVSTSCGISCVMFKNGNPVFVNSFNQTDRVPNEAFVNGKAMCLDDNTIVMQSIDHVVAFNPNKLKEVNVQHAAVLYPKLVRLLVNGNFVNSGEEVDGNVIIEKAITRVKEISLNANQNSISLTFSALNYFRPFQTYYRVRVDGIDSDWHVYSYFNGTGLVDSHGMLHLPLINLKPGIYKIEVQASMFPDVWEGIRPYVWEVHVNQAWWQATGVYMLFALLIIALLGVNFFMYNKNTRMRVRRNSEEGDIIRKICSFVEKCDAFSREKLAPNHDELFQDVFNDKLTLSPDFISIMMKLIPYVHQQKGKVTMRQLSEVGEVDIVQLYNIMTPNLYKSPSQLACLLALQKAAAMLRSTNKTVEEISMECNFYTPNYFMGCFFHEYKMTPNEYREESKAE